jgi:hypothetical protein
MKPSDNVAKDLSYQKMIYDKLLELDSRYAVLFPYTNLSQDVLQGGTRLRKHPLPGVSMETYEPSTLAVGNKSDDFHPKKSGPQIQRPPQKIPPKPVKGKPLTDGGVSNERIEIVKRVMKEKGLNLPQASKYVKENNLYQKMDKGVKSKQPKLLRKNANDTTLIGGVNRLKKAKRWKDFVVESANDGLDLVQKAKDPFKNIKSLFGGEVKKVKRPPSQWIQFVKQYASKKGIPYKQALKEASVEYKKMKGI